MGWSRTRLTRKKSAIREVTGMNLGGEPDRRRTSLTDWAIPLPPRAMPVSRMTEIRVRDKRGLQNSLYLYSWLLCGWRFSVTFKPAVSAHGPQASTADGCCTNHSS